ncbi:MAG: tyrosine-type recombinase/integrase [Xanthobacteraceae bacterium]
MRVGKGPRVRLHAEYGTPEFDEEYHAAITAQPRRSRGPATNTLAWLITRYRESVEWRSLSFATRRQRENIFLHVLETAGEHPFSKITKATVIAGRERRASTPSQARHFLDVMRGLFRWATDAGFVMSDPTQGVNNPRHKRGPGFVPWSEEHIAAYERRWPLGTRQRVWLDVLAYTGLRRGDAVRLGRQHVRDGVAAIKTEKSGFMVEVSIPILPVLQATLDAGPCGDLAFIAGAKGEPLTKESFGNLFRDACKAAGVPGSAHGVRKIAATRAANAGATVAQLEAIFGWQGGGMASLYTRAADRRHLALEAMHKLASNQKKTETASSGSERK